MSSYNEDQGKLELLMDLEGYSDINEILEDSLMDNRSVGICMNPGCDYTCDVEPDNDRGWCEVCDTNTVKSAVMLIGVI